MGYFVLICEGPLHDLGMHKFHGFSNYDGLYLFINDQEALVVFKGQTRVEAGRAALVPWFVVASFVVDENFANYGAKWCGIVIKWSMEVLTCRDARVECGLALGIEREFCLQEESVPQVSW